MTNLRRLLGSNIKKYRHACGLSQEKLAERAETSTNYVSAIETGRRFPSVETLEKIASVLGIDTPELFSMKPEHNDSAKKKMEEQVWHNIGQNISSYISKNIKSLKKHS